jgi:hypothetical protein
MLIVLVKTVVEVFFCLLRLVIVWKLKDYVCQDVLLCCWMTMMNNSHIAV